MSRFFHLRRGEEKARRRRASIGFTLIELLVAFTVFSVALMSILTIFPLTMRTIRQARLKVMATHVCQQAIEATFNQTFSTIVNRTATTNISTTLNGSTETTTFTTTVAVTTVNPALLDVNVTVTYVDKGRTYSNSMEAMVADKS